MLRTRRDKLKDFITFPVRAFVLAGREDRWGLTSRWGLSSLRSERFDYVAREVRGYCLDVGCGTYNPFVNKWFSGRGRGIDVFQHPGLTPEEVVEDITHFPFKNAVFDSVTFIANMNHIPEPSRDKELSEAYRCLKQSGNIVVTFGNPLAEIIIHTMLSRREDLKRTDGYTEEDDPYYVLDSEIIERLSRAGFKRIRKKYFLTQWGFNHLFVGWKT